MLIAFLQKILSLNIIPAMTNKNSERGRIHRRFLFRLALDGLATYPNLLAYASMIPCQECHNHYQERLDAQDAEAFIGSRQQMGMLYNLYTQIQTRKQTEIKPFSDWFSFYFNMQESFD